VILLIAAKELERPLMMIVPAALASPCRFVSSPTGTKALMDEDTHQLKKTETNERGFLVRGKGKEG
jgi:hypothetical protein